MTAPAFTRVYSGQDRVCRCGCKGTYAEAGTKLFTTRLKKLERMMEQAKTDPTIEIDDCGDYLNVSYGNDRALTAYRD